MSTDGIHYGESPMYKRQSRLTSDQKRCLLAFMEKHPEFASGKQDLRTKVAAGSLWLRLKRELDTLGPPKELLMWKRCWMDMKIKAKKKQQCLEASKSGESEIYTLSDEDRRILQAIKARDCKAEMDSYKSSVEAIGVEDEVCSVNNLSNGVIDMDTVESSVVIDVPVSDAVYPTSACTVLQSAGNSNPVSSSALPEVPSPSTAASNPPAASPNPALISYVDLDTASQPPSGPGSPMSGGALSSIRQASDDKLTAPQRKARRRRFRETPRMGTVAELLRSDLLRLGRDRAARTDIFMQTLQRQHEQHEQHMKLMQDQRHQDNEMLAQVLQMMQKQQEQHKLEMQQMQQERLQDHAAMMATLARLEHQQDQVQLLLQVLLQQGGTEVLMQQEVVQPVNGNE